MAEIELGEIGICCFANANPLSAFLKKFDGYAAAA